MTTQRVAAVVVAGGSGERFGRPQGKQLVSVSGWPVLSWALRGLASAPAVTALVVVCPAERREEYLAEAILPLGLSLPVAMAASGTTRQESVAAGLAAVPADTDLVLVHDGARPLVTPQIVESLLCALAADPSADGAIIGHPSVDTLKLAEGGAVAETPDRSRFWAVQTPQVFTRSALEAAHRRAVADGFVGTDDSSLVERGGGRVLLVEGPRDNIKVTLPEDIAFVNAVLQHRRQGD